VREIKRRFRDVEVVVVADEPWVIEALKHLAAVLSSNLSILSDGGSAGPGHRTGALHRRLRKQPAEIARKVERQFSQRLETERFLVVKQIVDKLSTFIGRIAQDVQGGVGISMKCLLRGHPRPAWQVLAANRAYACCSAARSATTAGRCMRAGPARRTAHR